RPKRLSRVRGRNTLPTNGPSAGAPRPLRPPLAPQSPRDPCPVGVFLPRREVDALPEAESLLVVRRALLRGPALPVALFVLRPRACSSFARISLSWKRRSRTSSSKAPRAARSVGVAMQKGGTGMSLQPEASLLG